MKPFLIITGMHRSGTSFLARALNLAGIHLGDIESIATHEWKYHDDNLRGHWENKTSLELLEKTLSINNGSWHDIPQKITITEEMGKEIHNFIDDLSKKTSLGFGFKDPRILICLDSWLQYIPQDFIIVGIFRHPLKVAESLKQRNQFSYEKSLKLWEIYNNKLISYLEKFNGFLLDFDWPKEKLFAEINKIYQKLGLEETTLTEWYTEELFHSDKTFQSDYKLTNDITNLYSKLQERSLNNDKVSIKKISYKEADLKSMIKNLLMESQSQQRYFMELNDKLEETQSRLDETQSRLEDAENQITILQQSLEISQKMIMDYHQSFVFRMLQKYDNSIGKIIPLQPKKYLMSSKEIPKQDEKLLQTVISNKTDLKKKDLLCFPIIPWSYRYQRPQHLISRFAKNGHRVFYLTTTLRTLNKSYYISELVPNVYQIELSSPRYFDIYKDKMDASLTEHFANEIQELQNELNLDAVSYVMFPTWEPLVMELKKHGFQIIYDCMDEYDKFSNVNKQRIEEERRLMKTSDLVVTTSSYLFDKASTISKKTILLPNAGEFTHFNKHTNDNILKDYQKPIIGYFGSIAEWFDIDLIEYVARNRPNVSFVFIGHTIGSDIRKLSKLPNVHFLGERPYLELPRYLHCFDACLIPFKDTKLIEATHPVKVYEYMAAGKPVVATKIRELSSMKELCYIAENKSDFLQKIDLALAENNEDMIKKRMDFASKNTWDDRFDKLYGELGKIPNLNLQNHA